MNTAIICLTFTFPITKIGCSYKSCPLPGILIILITDETKHQTSKYHGWPKGLFKGLKSLLTKPFIPLFCHQM